MYASCSGAGAGAGAGAWKCGSASVRVPARHGPLSEDHAVQAYARADCHGIRDVEPGTHQQQLPAPAGGRRRGLPAAGRLDRVDPPRQRQQGARCLVPSHIFGVKVVHSVTNMAHLRTPHLHQNCPFGGCRTCCPQPSPPPAPATARYPHRQRQLYRPTGLSGDVQLLTACVEHLDLTEETLLPALPQLQHDRLQHGMGCALCRNHYWTQGQAQLTFWS